MPLCSLCPLCLCTGYLDRPSVVRLRSSLLESSGSPFDSPSLTSPVMLALSIVLTVNHVIATSFVLRHSTSSSYPLHVHLIPHKRALPLPQCTSPLHTGLRLIPITLCCLVNLFRPLIELPPGCPHECPTQSSVSCLLHDFPSLLAPLR